MKAFFFALAGGLVLSASALDAAPQSVAEIANYAGADRQQVLEAGARKEGVVVIYNTGTQTKPVMDAFGAKYPFLKVENYRGDATAVTRRVIEEYKAGRYAVDNVQMTTGGLYPIRDAGYLQPYVSPELAVYKKEALEPGRHWAIDFESYSSVGWNTKLVSESEIPKVLDDLLDPKWKGKMAVPGSTTLGNWVGGLILDKGEDFVRKLGQQQIRVYEISGRAVANLVVSGEVVMSPAVFNSSIYTSKQEGANVAWRAVGGTYATIDAMAIAAKAPHPHAAMLYADFFLSREGQVGVQKLGYASARNDMENGDKPAKIHYLTERPDYVREYERWNLLARQVFGKGEVPPEAK
jgi:iron(III) transport system substrate-binding protein